jgi:hypothetical protein
MGQNGMKCIFIEEKKIGMNQVSDVAHEPLVCLLFFFLI